MNESKINFSATLLDEFMGGLRVLAEEFFTHRTKRRAAQPGWKIVQPKVRSDGAIHLFESDVIEWEDGPTLDGLVAVGLKGSESAYGLHVLRNPDGQFWGPDGDVFADQNAVVIFFKQEDKKRQQWIERISGRKKSDTHQTQ